MMRISLFSELYKLFSKKLFLILLAGMLIFNGFFLYNSQIKGTDIDFVSAGAKISLDKDLLKILDNSNRLKFVEERLKAVSDSDKSFYTGDSGKDRRLLEGAKRQLAIISDYKAYSQSVSDKAKNITDVSIFADKGSFSYKNAEATARDFERLADVQTSYDISHGVNAATDFLLTDLIVILLLFMIVDAVIGSDRSINITGLQRSLAHGRGRLALLKIAALFISTAAVCLLFYGVNYIISGTMYGFGDLTRPIQSVEGFAGCTLEISVLWYLILFMLLKLAVMFMLCLIIGAISLLGKSRLSGYVAAVLIFLVSYILYIAIGDNTGLMSLKYLNLLSFVNIHGLIANYRNINIFTYPLNYRTAFFISVTVLLAVFAVLFVLIYKRRIIAGYDKYSQSVFSKLKLPHGGVNTTVHEMYKALVSNKAGLFLLILIAVQAVVCLTSPLNLSEDEKYEKYYFSHFAGEFNDAKSAEIKTELERLKVSNEEYLKLGADYQSGLISESEYMDKSSGLSDAAEEYRKFEQYVEPYYEYLTGQREEGREVSVMFYEGFNVLLGIRGELSGIYCLALYALLVICVIPIFTGEYEKRTTRLLSSTRTGIKMLTGKKLICALIIAAVLNILIWIPYIFRAEGSYGLYGLCSSACSVPNFENLGSGISVLHILLIAFAVRLITSLLITVFIAGISVCAKNTIVAVLISSLIFVVPVLLPLNDVNILNNLSFYHLQNFGVLLAV